MILLFSIVVCYRPPCLVRFEVSLDSHLFTNPRAEVNTTLIVHEDLAKTKIDQFSSFYSHDITDFVCITSNITDQFGNQFQISIFSSGISSITFSILVRFN